MLNKRSHNKAPIVRCPPRTPYFNVAARAGEPEASGRAIFRARPAPLHMALNIEKGGQGVWLQHACQNPRAIISHLLVLRLDVAATPARGLKVGSSIAPDLFCVPCCLGAPKSTLDFKYPRKQKRPRAAEPQNVPGWEIIETASVGDPENEWKREKTQSEARQVCGPEKSVCLTKTQSGTKKGKVSA